MVISLPAAIEMSEANIYILKLVDLPVNIFSVKIVARKSFFHGRCKWLLSVIKHISNMTKGFKNAQKLPIYYIVTILGW